LTARRESAPLFVFAFASLLPDGEISAEIVYFPEGEPAFGEIPRIAANDVASDPEPN
jgi:hypothetical protein